MGILYTTDPRPGRPRPASLAVLLALDKLQQQVQHGLLGVGWDGENLGVMWEYVGNPWETQKPTIWR